MMHAVIIKIVATAASDGFGDSDRDVGSMTFQIVKSEVDIQISNLHWYVSV